MNIFQAQRRQEALSKIQIESSLMLDVYRLYKSIELFLLGRYDYLKYKRLQNLTRESFAKESGDMKQAIRALSHNHIDQPTTIIRCLLVSVNHLHSMNLSRSSLALKSIYSIEKMTGYNYLDLGCEGETGFESPANILFESQNITETNFKKMADWVTSSETINYDFFKCEEQS